MITDTRRIRIKGRSIAVRGNDIDTDRIIPARYLRCVVFDGLGEHSFEDDRQQLAAAGQTHAFDRASHAKARVLLVNKNFGCGSSREHAPQALMRWNEGIAAIVGESFSEIFFGNCVALGIPCLTVSQPDIEKLQAASDADAALEFAVDLQSMQVSAGALKVPCSMPEAARGQLVSGRWDSSAELLDGLPQLEKTATALPYFKHWA
jgi:3-isopropylmalate/(R)-2-methylmalate dehydratase small subunit